VSAWIAVHLAPTTSPHIFFALFLATATLVRARDHCCVFRLPRSVFLPEFLLNLYICYLSSTLHATRTRSKHLDLTIIRQAEGCVVLLLCFHNFKISGWQNSEAEIFRCAYWQIAKFRLVVGPLFSGPNSSRLWRLRKYETSASIYRSAHEISQQTWSFSVPPTSEFKRCCTKVALNCSVRIRKKRNFRVKEVAAEECNGTAISLVTCWFSTWHRTYF